MVAAEGCVKSPRVRIPLSSLTVLLVYGMKSKQINQSVDKCHIATVDGGDTET